MSLPDKSLADSFAPAAQDQRQKFEVRPIRPGDEADILRLLSATAGDISEDNPRHPKYEAERLVAASRETSPVGIGWLAIADGKGVGIISSQNRFSGGIYVEKDYRRLGIAEALVGAREDFQRAQGETRAVAHILPENTASIRLHEKLGYQRVEGTPGTLLVFSKPLGDAPSPAAPTPPGKPG